MFVIKHLIFFKGIINPKKIQISEKLKVRIRNGCYLSFWFVMRINKLAKMIVKNFTCQKWRR